MNRWIGIRRASCYSPGSVQRDEVIFSTVCHVLEERGCSVDVYDETIWCGESVERADGIFSMGRSPEVIRLLSVYERQGIKVVNSALAMPNSIRFNWTALFEKAGIPQPETKVVALNGLLDDKDIKRVSFPCWVKRCDDSSQTKNDICWVSCVSDLLNVLADFRYRGHDKVMLSAHVSGDLVKFYGVAGTSFFHISYPTVDGTYGKFGWERINGIPAGYIFDVDRLKVCCDQAARITGITVYGGDCIVTSDGNFKLIDWNDWPSFSPCVSDAAIAIVDKLLGK